MTETQENKMERDYIDVGLVHAINYLAKDMGFSREVGKRNDIEEVLLQYYQNMFVQKAKREMDAKLDHKMEWGMSRYYETHK